MRTALAGNPRISSPCWNRACVYVIQWLVQDNEWIISVTIYLSPSQILTPRQQHPLSIAHKTSSCWVVEPSTSAFFSSNTMPKKRIQSHSTHKAICPPSKGYSHVFHSFRKKPKPNSSSGLFGRFLRKFKKEFELPHGHMIGIRSLL